SAVAATASPASDRALTTRAWPRSASSRASRKPSPRLAPVTIATGRSLTARPPPAAQGSGGSPRRGGQKGGDSGGGGERSQGGGGSCSRRVRARAVRT